MDKSSPVEHPDLSITGHLSAFLIPGRAKTFKISMQLMGLPEFEPELVTNMIYFGFLGHLFIYIFSICVFNLFVFPEFSGFDIFLSCLIEGPLNKIYISH